MNEEKYTIRDMSKFMASVKEELIAAVEEKIETKIETKVNGKIKDIAETLRRQNEVQVEHGRKLDSIWEKMGPVLEDRRDREGANRTFLGYAKYLVYASTLIGAWYVVKEFLIK